jgi:hypothetical protein
MPNTGQQNQKNPVKYFPSQKITCHGQINDDWNKNGFTNS